MIKEGDLKVRLVGFDIIVSRFGLGDEQLDSLLSEQMLKLQSVSAPRGLDLQAAMALVLSASP